MAESDVHATDRRVSSWWWLGFVLAKAFTTTNLPNHFRHHATAASEGQLVDDKDFNAQPLRQHTCTKLRKTLWVGLKYRLKRKIKEYKATRVCMCLSLQKRALCYWCFFRNGT